jgi:hypothetical protein
LVHNNSPSPTLIFNSKNLFGANLLKIDNKNKKKKKKYLKFRKVMDRWSEQEWKFYLNMYQTFLEKRERERIRMLEKRERDRERERLGMDECWQFLPIELWLMIKKKYLKIIGKNYRDRLGPSRRVYYARDFKYMWHPGWSTLF